MNELIAGILVQLALWGGFALAAAIANKVMIDRIGRGK